MPRYVDADKIFYRERMTVWYNSKSIKEDIAFKQDIENVQTEDVAPVIHAHWIDDGYYADFHPHKVYRCSNCDWSKLDVELPEEKYCPDCGAKMDEVE